MVFVALMISVLVVYYIQTKLYAVRVFGQLRYRAYFESEETEEGNTVHFYEEISNLGSLPIPNAKVNTELPDGLKFIITDKRNGALTYTQGVQSVFVLRGGSPVRRKWRVRCEKRGVYSPRGCVMIINDLFGTEAVSRTLTFAELEDKRNTVLSVFPAISPLPECGAENRFILGDKTVVMGLLADPLQRGGIREYRDGDPQNAFNWAATAAHDKLLVNSYEYTRERKFNVILNLCSRDNERDAHIPSTPSITEDSIKLCASLLDMAALSQPDVRLIINTPSDIEYARGKLAESPYRTLGDSEAEKRKNAGITAWNAESDVLITKPFCGKRDTLEALRVLSEIPCYYSCTLERLLDGVAEGELPLGNDGSFVVVTPYVNERILNFYDVMLKRGVRVAFYVSSAVRFDISSLETGAEIIYAS